LNCGVFDVTLAASGRPSGRCCGVIKLKVGIVSRNVLKDGVAVMINTGNHVVARLEVATEYYALTVGRLEKQYTTVLAHILHVLSFSKVVAPG
jgi:hypothetical protein